MIEESGGILADSALLEADTLDLNIASTDTPWINWLAMVPRRRVTPLDAQLERDVEGLMAAADCWRLSIVPTTKAFAAMWTTFRGHHENLEDNWSYRRQRWLVWRACALKVIYDRGVFQDVVDHTQCHNKLVATLAWFWPGIKPDGFVDGYQTNFWRTRADDNGSRDPLGEYTEMVLSLTRAAVSRKRQHHG